MDSSAPPSASQRRHRWRGRFGATALSGGAHVALLVALLVTWRAPPMAIDQPAIDVSLAPAPAPAPKPPAPPAARKKAPAKPPRPAAARRAPIRLAAAPRKAARRTAPQPVPDPWPAAPASAAASADGQGLTEAQIAGAAIAGEGDGVGNGVGDGGGECDMAQRVQAALRKDPLARAAVHAASGRAIMIWNGDWVQAGTEDGKGLAAVREAITWEVAFAPPACRRQRVRGLVLLSLNDGSARVALGAGEWRWSDLLGLR